MRSSRRRHATVLVIALAVTSGGCSGGTPTPSSPSSAAGSYVLETVSGHGPDDGSFALGSDGRAERRVHYPKDSHAAPMDSIAVGTFRLPSSSAIEFSLRQDSGRSNFLWSVRGKRSGDKFSIQYVDPENGAQVVETYRRR